MDLTPAQSAARYMIQHNWLRDGVAEEQVAAVIDRERTAKRSLTTGPVYSSRPEAAAIELIDGAYDIIEIYPAAGPYSEAWKRAWLAKARELGANPSP